MMLNPQQIKIIEETFEKIVPISETAASIFYDRLFEVEPKLRHLFKGDIESQGRKLMQTLGVSVKSIHNFAALKPILEDLADSHVSYGVSEKDYDTVGETLLYTLDKGLGSGFTQEVKDAWSILYSKISKTMTDHAYS